MEHEIHENWHFANYNTFKACGELNCLQFKYYCQSCMTRQSVSKVFETSQFFLYLSYKTTLKNIYAEVKPCPILLKKNNLQKHKKSM